MTNREWLMEQMQNMSDEEFAEAIFIPKIMEEEVCKGFDCFPRECEDCKLNWLQAEHKEKPKLSDAERVILENISKMYKWICRCNNGFLYVASGTEPPFKEDGMWKVYFPKKNDALEPFNHLFKFIKWSDKKPYNIEELLKGE